MYMVDLVLHRFILPCRIILHDAFNSARALSHIMNSTGYSQKVMDIEAGIVGSQCGKFDFHEGSVPGWELIRSHRSVGDAASALTEGYSRASKD